MRPKNLQFSLLGCKQRLDRYVQSWGPPWLWFCLLAILLGVGITQAILWTGQKAMQLWNPPLVTQQLRYNNPGAAEMVFVWGINGWNLVSPEIRPGGTVIRDGVMHSPMIREGNTFIATIQVPVGAKIDYGFLITQASNGVTNTVWEANGDQDFHLIATEDKVVEIGTPLSPGQDQALISANNMPPVTLKIRYHSPEAGEVFFLWGINGWNLVPVEIQPPHTVVEDAVMRTPMTGQGDNFFTRIQVPFGATVDYGFLVTKKRSGAAIKVWEADGDDSFHMAATEDTEIEVQTAVTLAQANELPVDFEVGPQLLMGICVIFGLGLILNHLFDQDDKRMLAKPVVMILCTGASLFFLLLLFRLNIVGFNWISVQYSLVFVPDMLAAGYYDLFYVVAVTALFLTFLVPLRKNLKAQRSLYLIYSIIALLSLLIGFSNIQVVHMLGRPFNYQWFYYSDFLGSQEAQSAIFANVSSSFLLNLLTLSAALVISARSLLLAITLLPHYKAKRLLMFFAIASLLVYFPFANWYISTNAWDYPKLANPIVSFLQSVMASRTYPSLFTLELPADSDVVQEFIDKPLEKVSMQYQIHPELRNVVIFVLESVPAEYLEAYGGAYPVTPELNAYRQHSLLFNNIYAHAPASNKSLVSILSSIYPWISYKSLTQEFPEVRLPTLSSELKEYGYRTAFISASNTSFQRGDEFLSHRRFDVLADYDDLDCAGQRFNTDDWSFLDGVDEECMVEAFNNWEAQNPEQPFFAMLWTTGTHYPYFVVDEEINFGVDDKTFNRYLNALRHSDKVVGKLLRSLEKRGLLASTLVVLVGDHGEAFGRHDQTTHASKIYEENVHVPLIIINPRLFSGEENPTIGGHVDIAPTIMHLLNLPAPDAWQGQSLFATDRSNRTYFYTPWSEFLFGFREDNLKFIFNATDNSYEIYDLRHDPYETTNLAGQLPDVVSTGHKRLAAWVQYQDRFIRDLLNAQGGEN